MAPAAASTRGVVLDVEGMSCGNCERTVERLLGGLDGVVSVDADRATATARVTFDPARVAAGDLIVFLERATYYRVSVRGAETPPARRTASAGQPALPVVAVMVLGALAVAAAALAAVQRRGRS